MPHALIVVRDEDARRHLAEAARARAFSVSMATCADAGLTQMETRFPDLLFLDRGFGGRSREVLLDRVRASSGGSAVLVGPDGEGGGAELDRTESLPSFLSCLRDPLETERLEAILLGVAGTGGEGDPAAGSRLGEGASSPGGAGSPETNGAGSGNGAVAGNGATGGTGARGENGAVQETRAGNGSRPARTSLQRLRGTSPAMKRVRHLVTRVAPSRASVLVCGESGAGKERVARTIHDLSPRRREPFVAVNCGAISANLMESQIFGHEKGSFSGATRRHRGLFEQANGGTLLLDEITEMPLELQVKLLRVLETGSVVRVGAESALEVDVRILATTNRPPEEAMAQGKLRADLYYRLRILEVEVPPLRDRLEDLPSLARSILAEIGETEGQEKSMGPSVLRMLQGYRWPGNVRELRNALYTAFLLSEGPELDAACIPAEVTGACRLDPEPGLRAIRIPVETSIREAERQLILMTLAHMEGRKDRTAEALGVSLKTLYNRLHEYGCMGGNGAGPSS